MDDEIIINGVKYRPITKEAKQAPQYSRRMNTLMGLATIFGGMSGMYGGGNNYERKLDSSISICGEYELIQQKKSKLSKWERDVVIRNFERNYERVRDGE